MGKEEKMEEEYKEYQQDEEKGVNRRRKEL